MTYEQAEQAYYQQLPVIHKDIEYLCISALIQRRNWKGEHIKQVELTDTNKRSVTIALPEHVKLKEEKL